MLRIIYLWIQARWMMIPQNHIWINSNKNNNKKKKQKKKQQQQQEK